MKQFYHFKFVTSAAIYETTNKLQGLFFNALTTKLPTVNIDVTIEQTVITRDFGNILENFTNNS